MWNYKTPGIPDEFFERTEKVPITKEEVRTIQLSKARLTAGQTVYDIGCGSGSISIEAALQVENTGKVIAIDYDSNAVELTKKNIEKFGVSNISVIFGNAKEKILELEKADVIFIGGTGGAPKEIVELSQNKL
jgi:cobalt-precorrin-6B (C15)-methyltransferase